MSREKIKLENVKSVYSGINGRCCCGCSGKHTYPSTDIKAAGKARGYEIQQEEISDRTVKMMINKINKQIELNNIEYDEEDFISCVVGNRVYIAYLK